MATSFAHGKEAEVCKGCERESFVGLSDGLCYLCGMTHCRQCLKMLVNMETKEVYEWVDKLFWKLVPAKMELRCPDCNPPRQPGQNKRKRSDEEIADIKMKRIKEAVGHLFAMLHHPHRFN
jgi:hypothetical protein